MTPNDANTTEINQTTVDIVDFFKTEQFTVLCILFIVIVGGNVGVLYTLLFSRSRKSRMNYFITHLAIADLSVGLINVLTDIIWKITVDWYAGNYACKLVRFLQVLVTYASTYVLVALSIDRYDAIRNPMKFAGSWKRAKLLVGGAWLAAALLSLPIPFLYEQRTIPTGNFTSTVQCWLDLDAQWKWQVFMTLVAFSVFFVPAVVIAGCYAVIILTIWSKNGAKGFARSELKRASSRGLIPKAKIKTIKITFVIISVFIICWSPYIIFDLWQVYDHLPKTKLNVAIATFIQSLAPLNSAANPIIYCCFSTHFCHTLRALPPFCWLLRSEKRKYDDVTLNTQSSSLSEFLTNNKRRIDHSSTNLHHPILVH